MEQEIRTSLPNGNPLVAYGTAPRWNPRRTAVIAAGAVVFLVLAPAITYLFVGRVSAPDGTAAVAAVRTTSAFQESLPNIWGKAARTGAFPAVLGLAVRDGKPEPYVITSRWADIPFSHVRRSGPFAVWSDVPLSAWTERRPLDVVQPFIRLLRVETFLSVDLGRLASGIGTGTVSGPFIGNTWMTDVVLPNRNAQSLPPGDLSIDIASFPDAWTTIRAALAENGVDIPHGDMPSALGWSFASGTVPEISLRFDGGVPTTTILALASAAGAYDVVQVKLPDGEIVEELRPPVGRIPTDNPTRQEVTSGTWLSVSGTDASIQYGSSTGTEPTRTCKNGRPLVRLGPKALELVLEKTGVPTVDLFQTIEFSEYNGRMIVCFQ